jgi:hypothetical protein
VYQAAAASGLAQALISALLMNIAIVGINQLSDVEIDKASPAGTALPAYLRSGWFSGHVFCARGQAGQTHPPGTERMASFVLSPPSQPLVIPSPPS